MQNASSPPTEPPFPCYQTTSGKLLRNFSAQPLSPLDLRSSPHYRKLAELERTLSDGGRGNCLLSKSNGQDFLAVAAALSLQRVGVVVGDSDQCYFYSTPDTKCREMLPYDLIYFAHCRQPYLWTNCFYIYI
jgi:hypothetical protein